MAIAYDTTSNGSGTSGMSWSHTTSGSNRVLFVAVSENIGVSLTVTYGGQSMTQMLNPTLAGIGFYYLFNAPLGTNTISVTGSGGAMQGCATSYNGVSLSGNPEASNLNDSVSSTNTMTNSTTTVTDKAWVVGLAGQNTVSGTISAGTGSTQRVSLTATGSTGPVALYDNGSAKTPAGSVSMQVNSTSSARFFFYTYAIKPSIDNTGAVLMQLL